MSEDYYRTCGIPKPEPRKRSKAREKRQQAKDASGVRAYVFARERDICRCCRSRRAESRHELRFRSLGGKVTKANCVAVCGDGVQGCHGFLQRNEITYVAWGNGAEDSLTFQPMTARAREWMKLADGQVLLSAPMRDCEFELHDV